MKRSSKKIAVFFGGEGGGGIVESVNPDEQNPCGLSIQEKKNVFRSNNDINSDDFGLSLG